MIFDLRSGQFLVFPFLVLLCLFPVGSHSLAHQLQRSPEDSAKKILVVMSYHESYTWHQETREGLESDLQNTEITYFYLDTKKDLAGGEEKARQAYELYRTLQPDVVVAADDNAQSLFVVPYLKDKVNTPVVFCGVNDEAGKYGFPNAHITGVVEKKHYRESISLAKLISPKLQKVSVIYRDTPSNRTNIAQLKSEQNHYRAELTNFEAVETVDELKRALAICDKNSDALLLLNLSGLQGSNSQVRLDNQEITSLVNRFWHKPSIGISSWEIEMGLLCAVAKTGQEQGHIVGHMLLDIFAGKPVSEIPVTQNKNGQRIINISTAQRIGIKLKPIAILGAKLVK